MMLPVLLLVFTLRQAYDAHDYAAGVEMARASEPSDPEQRAYYIACLLYVDEMEGRRLAQEMRVTHPESPWTWFVLAEADQDELDHFAENKLIAEKLEHETIDDLVIARARALSSIFEGDAALKALDDHLSHAQDRARVLVAKAEILQETPHNEEKTIAAFREALTIDPSNIAALSALGTMLKQRRRGEEAQPFLERAAQLSPTFMATRLPNAAALDALVRERGYDPYILWFASLGYQKLKMEDRACELQERILREAPTSAQALAILRSRVHTHIGWRDLLDYPYRRDPEFIAMASIALLRDEKEPPTDEELVKLVHGIPVSVRYLLAQSNAVQKLADRKLDLEYAEKVARELIPLGELAIRPLQFDPSESNGHTERLSRGLMRDTLGWVLFAQGKTKEAEKELTAARSLYPESSAIAYHLGRLSEAQKMTTKAEELYREGMTLQSNGTNPNRGALEALYRRRHKTLAGFETYLKRVNTTGDVMSRDRVLKTRIAKPIAPPDFHLKQLDGKTVSLADLKGKVAVVNFWGVWCGWCVKEMPDFVKLAKRYAHDDRVRIVTVDTDADPAVVRQWMAEQHYDFPVLLDDGWVHTAGVTGYPTTWFLDPQGRIAFKKEGWTEKLVDQFSWRIDVLKK